MDTSDSFSQTFAQLKQLLAPYEEYLKVTGKRPGGYELIIDKPVTLNGRTYPTLYFASADIQKNYVTLHFFPIYTHPDHFKDMPEHLAKCLKGKGCFNFKKMDNELAGQTEYMIAQGFELYNSITPLKA